MQTIIIKLDSEKLINADLDMRYKVPDYIETYTDGVVTDNGYDYVNESGTGSLPYGLIQKTPPRRFKMSYTA